MLLKQQRNIVCDKQFVQLLLNNPILQQGSVYASEKKMSKY